jgi:hypothetical protein
MKRMLLICALFLAALPATLSLAAEETPEINTVLMRSTFKLAGKGAMGTAFILGKPSASDPQKAYFVLVTAGHVLKQMQGDEAILFLRSKTGDTFQKKPYPIKIRKDGRPIWTAHPEADISRDVRPSPYRG